jgi:hypothetical protein
MATTTLNYSENEASLIECLAKRRGTTSDDLIAQIGVSGAVTQALQEEIQTQVNEGTVGKDTAALLLCSKDWGMFWGPVYQGYQKDKSIPASIVSGAMARASK